MRDMVVSGASHVEVGSFYPSHMKKYEVMRPPIIVAQAISELAVSVCVIGDMTAENRAPLISLGAQMKIVIGSVCAADDPHMAAVESSALFR